MKEGDSVDVVSFIHMANGTKADYELLARLEVAFNQSLPDRLLQALDRLKESLSGYQVSRYEHSLQSATRAYRAGESEAMVVAALLHDIGDELAPYTHGEMVAAILKPIMSPKTCWVIKYHGLFQTYYYGHHTGEDRNARDQFEGHPWYQACVDFCHDYDQNCFDPSYDSLPVSFFEPMVRRIFTQPPRFGDDGNRQ